MSDAPGAPRSWRLRIFGLTWLSYFSFYIARKNFSVVKKRIEDVGLGSKADFAAVDSLYLATYAGGQFLWGFVGDAVSARRLVAAGMFAAAALALAVGLSGTMAVLLLGFGLNGLAQSTGWPGNGRITASWFGAAERGVWLGFWGTCYQVGPIAATVFATALLGRFGWRAAFIGPGLWVAVAGFAVWLWVRDRPSDVGFRDPDAAPPVDRAAARLRRRAAWRAMFAHKTIWLLALSYFSAKFIRYSLWFWLPYYFGRELHYSDTAAGYMSTSFDLGGIAGVIAGGWVADRLLCRRRVGVAMASFVLLAGALLLYRAVGASSMVANFVAMGLVGVFLFSADSLVSGAAAQDAGGPDGAGAACGFVNGVGSLGGFLQGPLTVWVSDAFGWDAVLYLFVGLAVAAAVTLAPLARHVPTAAT
ncbi:MAG: MFS transporter [Deltaproteobacteria bacterium]|nr:MAG: MFS transporter [Deltaproteobacteria bacterium]